MTVTSLIVAASRARHRCEPLRVVLRDDGRYLRPLCPSGGPVGDVECWRGDGRVTVVYDPGEVIDWIESVGLASLIGDMP